MAIMSSSRMKICLRDPELRLDGEDQSRLQQAGPAAHVMGGHANGMAQPRGRTLG
jgi:hypothetical protein